MKEHAVRIFISEDAYKWLKQEGKLNKRRAGPHAASLIEQLHISGQDKHSEKEEAA